MILSVLLLCISLNLDALCVGFTYGVRDIRIPISSKLILLALSAAFSFLALFCGRWLLLIFPPFYAKLSGLLLLFLLGAYTLLKAAFERPAADGPSVRQFSLTLKQVRITIHIMQNPAACDLDCSNSIEPKEALYLGTALSVDAVAAGIAASLNGLSPLYIPFAIGLCQYLFITIGRYVGTRFHKRLKICPRTVNMIAGGLLMLLSVLRLFF